MKKILIYWFIFLSLFSLNANSQKIDKDFIKRIKNTDSIDKLFTIKEIVKLETNANCLISNIKEIIRIENFYFVLDDRQNKVLKFDSKGKFYKNIGGVGQGPGDYSIAFHIAKTFDNQISIFDPSSRKLLIYDLDGKYLKFINLPVMSVGGYLFYNKDNLIMFNCFSRDVNSPLHQIISLNEKKATIIRGFGKKIEQLAKQRIDCISSGKEPIGFSDYNGFYLNGKNIWYANHYCADFFIYNLENNIFKKITPSLNNINLFDKLPDKLFKSPSNFSEISNKYYINNMFGLKDYVLVNYSKNFSPLMYQLFDKNGNELSKLLIGSKKYSIKGTFGKLLIGSTFYDSIKLFKENYSENEFKKLLDLGLKKEGDYEDNPFIILSEH